MWDKKSTEGVPRPAIDPTTTRVNPSAPGRVVELDTPSADDPRHADAPPPNY